MLYSRPVISETFVETVCPAMVVRAHICSECVNTRQTHLTTFHISQVPASNFLALHVGSWSNTKSSYWRT
jgi:hypothetical protein